MITDKRFKKATGFNNFNDQKEYYLWIGYPVGSTWPFFETWEQYQKEQIEILKLS